MTDQDDTDALRELVKKLQEEIEEKDKKIAELEEKIKGWSTFCG